MIMKKSRGIWIDEKGYVWIRMWPFGYKNPRTGTINRPYLEYVGPFSRGVVEVAQERLLEYRLQILRKTFSLAPIIERMTFAEACDLYKEKHGKTLGSYDKVKQVLNDALALEIFNGKFIDEIGKHHIQRFREACKAAGNSATTVDRKHAI